MTATPVTALVALIARILCAAVPLTLSGCTTISSSVMASELHVAVWQPVTLDFTGPSSSETGALNPFTHFKLSVTFTSGAHKVTVPGFFAADGNAAETGADSGEVWRVRFAPDRPGQWTYSAKLFAADGAALLPDSDPKLRVHASWSGSFQVLDAPPDAPSFYRNGILRREGRYFRFSGSGTHWLKGGANSPENLLGYADFDGTYRVADNARAGEADAGGELHAFAPHRGDWRRGDPSWQGSKGKGLIGAVNYLADQGMNAAYFLVYNIEGDGKDVWPWRDPSDRTRFDVSKLAQWEIVFAHMQRRGIALHVVLQETENELILDGGDTGPHRKLFLRELIARFGHHPALFWNLGEENGPVHWLPHGQSDAQRFAMARHIRQLDAYGHPILLHTHSEAADKDSILAPQLGNRDIAGLSFQVSQRETVNKEIRKWQELSREAGHAWPIAMDEIGPWQIGARADRDDPSHDSLRRHALWGTLLAGGAGVEWYFGAEQDGNDLTAEDWRSRAALWRQTRIALSFFEQNLRFWEMRPCRGSAYCLADEGKTYAVYLSADTPVLERGAIAAGTYRLRLFDPLTGDFDLAVTTIEFVDGDLPRLLSVSPSKADRVALLERID
ncbi:MAG: DUF5060 domain-containing protein [Erythrobacter sp.]|nr:DUF5060 domain-containing protein [Erythrobacter sp.]